MKTISLLVGTLMAAAATTSAYSIDLWADYNYQGTQYKYVSLVLNCTHGTADIQTDLLTTKWKTER